MASHFGDTSWDRPMNFFEVKVLKNSLTPVNRVEYKEDKDLVIRFSELPPSLTVAHDANYVDERIPGRSEPWKVYSDSGAVLIDFTAKLVPTGHGKGMGIANMAFLTGGQVANRFGVDGILGKIQTVKGQTLDTLGPLDTVGSQKAQQEKVAFIWQEVHQRVAALEALTYPQYDSSGLAFPPPLVDLHYGGNFCRRGVIKNVRFTYLPPWEPTSGLSMQVECQVTMEEVNLVPKSYKDVRERRASGDGAAGKLQTFVRTPRTLLGLARSGFGL